MSFIAELKSAAAKEGNIFRHFDVEYKIYPKSIIEKDGSLFAVVKTDAGKFLLIYSEKNNEVIAGFDGENIKTGEGVLKRAYLNHKNRVGIQNIFQFAQPVLLGVCNSFGFGDRLGLANAGHLQALEGFSFRPVLAQQSIRELKRTNRTPADVMDAAVWAVLEEGYRGGFGADADHLKTTEDIDYMMEAGFTMFTFDPSDYVINDADKMTINQLNDYLSKIDWEILQTKKEKLIGGYSGKSFPIKDDFVLAPAEETILRAAVKYGGAIARLKYLYDYISNNYSGRNWEVEISVDETESATSPFEHFFVANELNRLNVEIIGLAPNFIGSFEKGIDYKGSIDEFKSDYKKHLLIAKHFGSYKLSIHSGSDKFKIYNAVGSFKDAYTHVKTAGTSYLEAVRVIAVKEPELFREILDYSRNLFDAEKKTYHVSAESELTKPASEYTDEELPVLLNDENARQILHVTYGRILTDKDENGDYKFKDSFFNCLIRNEEVYNAYLKKHFINHLKPFETGKL